MVWSLFQNHILHWIWASGVCASGLGEHLIHSSLSLVRASVCFSCLLVFSGPPRVLHLCVSWQQPACAATLLSKLMMPLVRLALADGCFGLVPSPPRLQNVIAAWMWLHSSVPVPQDGLYTQGKVHIRFSFLTAVGNENHVSFMPDISLALPCVAILSVLEREESQSAERKHSFFLSFFTVSGRLLLRWVTAPSSKSAIKQCTGWLLLLIFISHLPVSVLQRPKKNKGLVRSSSKQFGKKVVLSELSVTGRFS